MWTNKPEELAIHADHSKYGWLLHQGRLSDALQACCTDLTVQIISQQFEPILSSEQQVLNISEPCWVRQIYICGDNIPWVFARVVAPLETYRQYKQEFDELGTNLLGATILSKVKNLTRSEFSFSLTPDQTAKHYAPGNPARRSIFNLNGYDLLVTEVFLQQIPSYSPKQSRRLTLTNSM